MSSKAYRKVISKAEKHIKIAAAEIAAMDDASLRMLFGSLLRKLFTQGELNGTEKKIVRLSAQLTQIKGKLKSTLNTYVIANREESTPSITHNDIDKREDESEFLAPLLSLLEEVHTLESELRKKDTQYLIRGDHADRSLAVQDKTDWESLRLDT